MSTDFSFFGGSSENPSCANWWITLAPCGDVWLIYKSVGDHAIIQTYASCIMDACQQSYPYKTNVIHNLQMIKYKYI
jgi:hypothetical protein